METVMNTLVYRPTIEVQPLDQHSLMYIDRRNDFKKLAATLLKEQPLLESLWQYVAPIANALQDYAGILYIKDMVLEKPKDKVTDTVYWQQDASHHNLKVKGANVMMAVVNYDSVNIPVAYKVLKRSMPKLIKDKKQTMLAPSKTQVFKELMHVIAEQDVKYKYVVAESGVASQPNMMLCKETMNHDFIFAVSPHRAIAANINNQSHGKFQPLSSLDVNTVKGRLVFMDGITRPLKAIRNVYTDPVGNTHEEYFMTSDLKLEPEIAIELFKHQQSIQPVAQKAFSTSETRNKTGVRISV